MNYLKTHMFVISAKIRSMSCKAEPNLKSLIECLCSYKYSKEHQIIDFNMAMAAMANIKQFWLSITAK